MTRSKSDRSFRNNLSRRFSGARGGLENPSRGDGGKKTQSFRRIFRSGLILKTDMAIFFYDMARLSVKSTYSLDADTIRKLERAAARWHVSKSEVLRRAIDAFEQAEPPSALTPLQAFRELRKSVKGRLSQRDFERWEALVKRERQSFGRDPWRRR